MKHSAESQHRGTPQGQAISTQREVEPAMRRRCPRGWHGSPLALAQCCQALEVILRQLLEATA